MAAQTQIAIRLPDELLRFVDHTVKSGSASSRADLVTRALRHERRRLLAERDIELLAASGRDQDGLDGLDGLAEHAAETPMDDLD